MRQPLTGDLAESFTERLAALSRIHALLTGSRWRGAALHELVGAELSPYRLEEGGNITIEGMLYSSTPSPP